jgi:hypothetical protein
MCRSIRKDKYPRKRAFAHARLKFKNLFRNAPALVVIDMHDADSVDCVTQLVIDNDMVLVARGGCRRRQQLSSA